MTSQPGGRNYGDDNVRTMVRVNVALFVLALTAILSGSLALNLWNNDFPLGYHIDELNKVRFIQQDAQDFRHPVLMLELGRFAADLWGVTDSQAVAVAGRSISALFGTLTVLATFLVARHLSGMRIALLSACAVALMPLIVIHAHYLKEDMYLAVFVLLALHAFLRFQRSGTSGSLVWCGLTIGLAISSKYVGFLLVPFVWLAPAMFYKQKFREYWPRLLAMTVISLAVFMAINRALLFEPHVFIEGFEFEFTHAFRGHKIQIWPWDYLLTFHLRHSLAPGITWLWVVLGAAGMAYALIRRPGNMADDRTVIGFAGLWLFLTELSPTKPFPDFMRYVIPVTPIVVIYGVRVLDAVVRRMTAEWRRWGTCLAVAVALIWPATMMVQLVAHLKDDTRKVLASEVNLREPVVYERYTVRNGGVVSIAEVLPEYLKEEEMGHMVTSSFNYERYLLGGSLSWQKDKVYRYARRYAALFEACPFTTIPPGFRSYAFSNPELRIVDMQECDMERLRSELGEPSRPGPE